MKVQGLALNRKGLGKKGGYGKAKKVR